MRTSPQISGACACADPHPADSLRAPPVPLMESTYGPISSTKNRNPQAGEKPALLTLDDIRSVVRDEVRAALGASSAHPMSAAEACEYLSISRRTLQDWMSAHRIPVRRMHGNRGRLFFFRNELDEALRRFGRKAVWQP